MSGMSVTEIQLYKTLRVKIGDEAAQEIVNYIKSEINSELMECKQVFLTKDDKVDLIRSIYIAGVVQYLAMLGSLIGLVVFFLKR